MSDNESRFRWDLPAVVILQVVWAVAIAITSADLLAVLKLQKWTINTHLFYSGCVVIGAGPIAGYLCKHFRPLRDRPGLSLVAFLAGWFAMMMLGICMMHVSKSR
jgi:ABC-type Co2+ transport system permease subunit